MFLQKNPTSVRRSRLPEFYRRLRQRTGPLSRKGSPASVAAGLRSPIATGKSGLKEGNTVSVKSIGSPYGSTKPRAAIRRKLLILFALILPELATIQVVASEKADAMAPVHQFVDGFNKGDFKSAIAACADTAYVIDDFSPHSWQGSGCKEWADAFEGITKQESITEARIILGRSRHIDVTADRAYVVVNVRLDYKI